MQISSFKNSDINFEKIDKKNPYFYIIDSIKKIHCKEKSNILDIGCGREKKYQILSYELAKIGFSVTGIDLECKNEKPLDNLIFLKMAAEDVEKKLKEKFDIIISAYFFGYVTKDWSSENGKNTKDYELGLIKIIRNLLKDDGFCINYLNEMWTLKKDDLKSAGFHIIKFPKADRIPPIKNGLCILRKHL